MEHIPKNEEELSKNKRERNTRPSRSELTSGESTIIPPTNNTSNPQRTDRMKSRYSSKLFS